MLELTVKEPATGFELLKLTGGVLATGTCPPVEVVQDGGVQEYPLPQP